MEHTWVSCGYDSNFMAQDNTSVNLQNNIFYLFVLLKLLIFQWAKKITLKIRLGYYEVYLAM